MTILKSYLQLHGYVVCFVLYRSTDVKLADCRAPKKNTVQVTVIMIFTYLRK
jgi:hypothetical protein